MERRDAGTLTMARSDEIEIRQLLRVIWLSRWLVASITATFTIGAVAYALLATPVYHSQALVQIRDVSKPSGGLAGLAAQFGGLADLAGFSLRGGDTDREVALATLRSRRVIEPFLQSHNILPKMYDHDWDAKKKRWKSDDQDDYPSLWEAYNDFTEDIFQVDDDKISGLVTVSIDWKDPQEAKEWVTDLIARANAIMKSDAIEESESNLKYLSAQARQVSEVSLQQAFFGLMEAEQKKLMIAMGDDEYALKTIDPAAVPTKKDRPKRLLIVILGFCVGGILAIAIALMRII